MKPGTRVKVIRTNEKGTVVGSQSIPYVGTIIHVEMDNGTDHDFNRFELIEVA